MTLAMPREQSSPYLFFFFNDTATTEIYTLSLHDALPIKPVVSGGTGHDHTGLDNDPVLDRKSTRLNSSHMSISYAVFCLKKKKRKWNFHLTMKKKKTTRRILGYSEK